MATMGLLPGERDRPGSIRFEGRDLVGLAPEELRRLRGDRISMVFQDPMTSLDPAFPIGDQVAETITAHRDVDTKHGAGAGARAARRTSGSPSPNGATATRRTGCPAACASAS